MLDRFRNSYMNAVYDTDRSGAFRIVEEALASGIAPEEIVFSIVVPSIESMMRRISEKGDVNLCQHFLASQIAAEVTDRMVPKFKAAPESGGRIVIGTSHGDFHGLGKRIVAGCLKAYMIEVLDLGLNVAPASFVEEAVRLDARVIGISSMMLHTAIGENGCLKVRAILKERSLEGKIKIVVGGAPYRYDPKLFKAVEADAWAENGITAAKVIGALLKEAE